MNAVILTRKGISYPQRPSKILFLTYNNSSEDNAFLYSINKYSNITADCVFEFHCKPMRALRRIMINHNMPGLSVWFGDWYRNLALFRLCIVVGSSYTPNILEYLKRHFPDVRFISYLWDKEFFSHYPIISSKSYENWTFNRADADEYHLKYNPQFYTDNLILEKYKKEYDICIASRNPDRTLI